MSKVDIGFSGNKIGAVVDGTVETTIGGTVTTSNTTVEEALNNLEKAIGVPKSSDVIHISLPNQTPIAQLLSASSTYRISPDVDITYCVHVGASAEASAWKIPLWEKYIEVFNTSATDIYVSVYNATTSSGNVVISKYTTPAG